MYFIDVDGTKVEENPTKEETENGKKTKSRREGKKTASVKTRKGLKEPAKNYALSSKGRNVGGKLPEKVKTDKKIRAKPVDKSRSAIRLQKGVIMLVNTILLSLAQRAKYGKMC